MVEIQCGANKNSHAFNKVGACNRGYTQFVMETEQVGLSWEL